MTQSNPNNSSADERIKINLQIHIRAEEIGTIIQKTVFLVGTVPFQDCLETDPHLEPVMPEHLGLLGGCKDTIHVEG